MDDTLELVGENRGVVLGLGTTGLGGVCFLGGILLLLLLFCQLSMPRDLVRHRQKSIPTTVALGNVTATTNWVFVKFNGPIWKKTGYQINILKGYIHVRVAFPKL